MKYIFTCIMVMNAIGSILLEKDMTINPIQIFDVWTEAKRGSHRRLKRDGHKQDGHKQDGHKQDGHKWDGHKQDGHKQDGHKWNGRDYNPGVTKPASPPNGGHKSSNGGHKSSNGGIYGGNRMFDF